MFHVHLNFNFWQLFLEKCAKKFPKLVKTVFFLRRKAKRVSLDYDFICVCFINTIKVRFAFISYREVSFYSKTKWMWSFPTLFCFVLDRRSRTKGRWFLSATRFSFLFFEKCIKIFENVHFFNLTWRYLVQKLIFTWACLFSMESFIKLVLKNNLKFSKTKNYFFNFSFYSITKPMWSSATFFLNFGSSANKNQNDFCVWQDFHFCFLKNASKFSNVCFFKFT
jgi:hypothetical protein